MAQSGNPAKKAAAKKATKTPTSRGPEKTPAQVLKERQEALDARREREFNQRVEEATKVLDDLEESITQREWLLVTQGLDRTRDQIARDGSLRLLALAYLKVKRETGEGWDEVLGMTDKELVRLHGFPDETPAETKARLESTASETPPEERNRVDLEPRAPGQE